jgi:putative copper export protein/mono/diheme cytochrome c family protein
VIALPLHELLLVTGGRWLGLLALAVLVGGLVLDCFVLPRHAGELATARRRLQRWISVAIGVLLVTSAIDLLARARVMSGGDLSQVGTALPLVLTRTHFGTVWIARALILAALLALSVSRSSPGRMVAFVLALGVTLTGTLTGHAADWGDRSFTVLVDWLHAVAATAWTGGLFALAIAVSPAWSAFQDSASSSELLCAVAQRFSRLAGYCLLVVVASGVYNACVQVPTFASLWSTTYGMALLLKVVLALLLAFLGAVNRYLVLPGLGASRPRRVGRLRRLCRIAVFGAATAPGAARTRLSRLVGREAVVAVVVFGCTAVLAESTPKSHDAHMSQVADQEGEPAHITMQDLHAGGGVPKGWILTPPQGDAAKGREVFARLECYTCHAVAGEKFPRPSKVGPALSDVGHHHPPGYLLESVINPNAVIVEAPGYTGPDGRSIMPDYRDSLSTRELIDLIAYLKSLGG